MIYRNYLSPLFC